MKTIMSVDLEGDWDSKDTDNLKLIPKLLDLFEENKIKSTFFSVGEIVEQYPKLIKKIAKKHEIASHGYEHTNLKKLSKQELEDSIKKSKKSIEDLGIECIGFRSPMLIKPKNLFLLLKKYNYVYDSSSVFSIFPGRYIQLKCKPSFKDDILEIPISNLFIGVPFSLSYIRLFHPFSRLILPKNPLMFYLHSYEFLDKKAGKEVPSYIKPLTTRNRGKKAWKIFENVIREYEFISCKDYIKTKYLDPF